MLHLRRKYRCTLIFNISLFYIVVGILFVVYFISLYRAYRRGFVFSFYNISVVYYFVFLYLPYGLIVTGKNYNNAAFDQDWYFMSFYYSILVVVVGIVYNITALRKRVSSLGHSGRFLIAAHLNEVNDWHVLFFVLFKVFMLFFGVTIFQFLLFTGDFSAALSMQKDLHTTSGYDVLGLFYKYLGPIAAIVFITRAFTAKNRLYRLVLFFLAVETLAWYFKKSDFAVALFTFLILYMWYNKNNIFYFLAIAVLVVYAAFAYRLGVVFDYAYIWEVFTKRVVSETGYSLIHLKLINEAGPPLSFTDRYYLGFRTLFGIEPAGNWSREAYYMETGRYGATTSGYAPVNLYAFWGWIWVIVAPIILFFISKVDLAVVRRVGDSLFLRASYILISLSFVNALTVNLIRVVDYRFVFSPSLAITVFLLAFVYLFFIRKRKYIDDVI